MPRPHWIRSEKSRTLLSGVLLVVAAVAGGGLALVLDLTENHSLWFALLLGYSIYGSVHALFIVLAFRGLSGKALADAVLHGHQRDGRWRRFIQDRPVLKALTSTDEGPAWSSQLALMALIAVGALVVVTDRSELWWAAPLTALTVVVAWIDVAISYSVQYARSWWQHGGMSFPTDERTPPHEVAEGPAFSDFVYQALAVQTSFASSDVSLTNRTMRRLVTSHAVLAFIFSTVIIATLVSILITL